MINGTLALNEKVKGFFFFFFFNKKQKQKQQQKKNHSSATDKNSPNFFAKLKTTLNV